MPTRMIRDGLLESEAILSVPSDARWLFMAICLSADDLGLFEATEFRLHRKAGLPREHIGKLLVMLADVDLVRPYMSDGRALGFVPKFGQRLRIKSIKYPLPPPGLVADDLDAVNKIKHLGLKMPDTRPSRDRQCLSESESESETELKKSNTVSASASAKPLGKARSAGKPEVPATAAAAAPKPTRPAKPADPTPGSMVFDAYRDAYRRRYATDPVRNQKVNSLCKQVAERLGAEEAPHVAAFYVEHAGNLYRNSGHAVDLLLRDAEKLRTEWFTGRQIDVAATSFRQVDAEDRAARVFEMTGGRMGKPSTSAIAKPIDVIDMEVSREPSLPRLDR